MPEHVRVEARPFDLDHHQVFAIGVRGSAFVTTLLAAGHAAGRHAEDHQAVNDARGLYAALGFDGRELLIRAP